MSLDQLLMGKVLTGLQDSTMIYVETWMTTHPFLSWFLAHPLVTLILVVLILLMFWGFMGAIGRLTEKFWLTLLLSPFKLIYWLGQAILRLIVYLTGNKPPPALVKASPHDRLLELLNRLEAIKQEQDELLQEVRTILASRR